MSSTSKDPLKLVRRSKLFVPVNREKFVNKAWTRGADCIILDLEDSFENTLRQSLMMSHGSFTIFLTRPITLSFVVVAFLMIISPFIFRKRLELGANE